MRLQKDLREFVELLNSEQANYVIVGGYAVAYHGHPRFTGDIDFLVESSVQNAQKLMAIIRKFGDLDIQAADFLDGAGRGAARGELLSAR